MGETEKSSVLANQKITNYGVCECYEFKTLLHRLELEGEISIALGVKIGSREHKADDE